MLLMIAVVAMMVMVLHMVVELSTVLIVMYHGSTVLVWRCRGSENRSSEQANDQSSN